MLPPSQAGFPGRQRTEQICEERDKFCLQRDCKSIILLEKMFPNICHNFQLLIKISKYQQYVQKAQLIQSRKFFIFKPFCNHNY